MCYSAWWARSWFLVYQLVHAIAAKTFYSLFRHTLCICMSQDYMYRYWITKYTCNMLLREHSSTSCFPKLQLVLPLLSHVPLVSHCNLNQRMIQVHSCSANLSVVLLLLCCSAITKVQMCWISPDRLIGNLLSHRPGSLFWTVVQTGSEYHKDDCHMYIAGDGLEQVPCMLQATS